MPSIVTTYDASNEQLSIARSRSDPSPSVKLFCRFLFVFLRERDALSLFSTSCAFLEVVSAFAVPHKR
jgi:hypothetical protein